MSLQAIFFDISQLQGDTSYISKKVDFSNVASSISTTIGLSNYLPITGSATGATSQAQVFTNGMRGSIYDNAETPALSIDPNNRILYATDGTTPLLDWTNTNSVGIVLPSGIEDGSTLASIIPNSRTLNDTAGASAISWGNPYTGTGTGIQFNAYTSVGLLKTDASGFIEIDTTAYLTAENFSYSKVVTGKTVTIPENQQMIVYDEFTEEGTLVEDGELVIIN